MIFHIPTGTIVITPGKSASVSLHEVMADKEGFVFRSGPALWEKTDISNHCPLGSIKAVDSFPVKRTALLMRHPYRRVPSLWKYAVESAGYKNSFREWLHNIYPSGSLAPSAAYCNDPGWIIHAESMEKDLEGLFGQRFEVLFHNRSITPHPVLSDEDKNIIWDLYSEDFALGGYER